MMWLRYGASIPGLAEPTAMVRAELEGRTDQPVAAAGLACSSRTVRSVHERLDISSGTRGIQ